MIKMNSQWLKEITRNEGGSTAQTITTFNDFIIIKNKNYERYL